ncbi:uncharacterized protein LOC106362703 [Brassica napus]|uniref:uncharacterized protein LOC106362703 n=1 Tax=Brassica napus TaxID=3708 RepID=UPI002078719F|nr:uncharacterized protein LOC106362703 [Brassica napus]
MDTRSTTALSDMSKQIDELRSSQVQQTEEIRKELGGEINALKGIIEKFFADAQHVTQRAGKQTEASSEITDGTPQTKDPPDRLNPANSSAKTIPTNIDNNNNTPVHHSLSARLTKIGFPMFDGSELKEWIYRCEQFFSIDSTPPELKVRLASLHMTSKALQWHHSYIANRYNQFPLWPEYVAAISDRFSKLFDDPLSELVSLKQGNDTIDEYLDKFDCAMNRITLTPAHALSIFLTNMHQHLALHVRQFKVDTVPEAAKIAKLHELSLMHTPSRTARPSSNAPQRSNFSQTNKHQYNNSTPPTTTNLNDQNNKPLIANTPQKRISFEEMQERKRKGLCMFCEEPFTPGHQLKHRRAEFLFMEAETEFDEEIALEEQIRETTLVDDQDDKVPTISVHALNGCPTFNCMRLMGQYGKRKLHILIDPGSTHNFLNIQVAKGLGCSLIPTKPMSVVAASGDLITKYKCNPLSWKMQGYGFSTEIRTLPLGCSDLVLGVQWLSTLGPILWDFLNLRMEFNFQGLKHVLRGVSPNSAKVINGSSLNKLMLQEPQLALLHIRELDSTLETHQTLDPATLLYHIEASGANTDDNEPLQQLLASFADIFEEPTSLPPYREGFNHKIPLEAGANPVSLRPYRYSAVQKDAIDKMIREMVDQGIIQYSSSPYASPVVLVKKKDGSWRLCVYYRGLNKQTIKDKYPIPLLEDLLDELGGSKYFSKLDLRAGFHQLRMSPEDVHKTAFKTHSGHYEYLVMPFGLTNAPCTFQGLMNHVFEPILRKFLLVFFDDILIYSKTWEDHLHHLDMVFSILRHQQLYLKMSKCTFGATRIEYLGHFISNEGVSTDPAKIKAVET